MNQRLTDIRRAQLDQLLSGGTNMAGGGLLKAVALKATAKAAKPALKAVQEVLPAAEREANLAKFLEKSKIKNKAYHATDQDVKRFDPKADKRTENKSNIAGWMTNDPEFANDFAAQKFRHWKTRERPWEQDPNVPEGANIMPVHLSIENPFYATDLIKNLSGELNMDEANAVAKALGVGVDELLGDIPKAIKYKSSGYEREHTPRGFDLVKSTVATDAMKRLGHDGVIGIENGSEVYAPFEETQIKSATGNRGTYDTSKPDLNEAQGGLVHLAGGGDPKKAGSQYTLMGDPSQFAESSESKLYPKTERMNRGVKAIKSGLDSFNRFIDSGPSVRDVLGNVVGAVPFVGPDLRKGMEDSTLTIPYGFETSPTNPKVATGVQTAKVPTTDILDALKMSDITGGTGASNLLGSVGKGYAPDPMDVLDTLGLGAVGYGVAKAGAKGVKGVKDALLVGKEAKAAKEIETAGTKYATQQEGPFFRVQPTTLGKDAATTRGTKEADGLRATPAVAGGAEPTGRKVPQLLSPEEVGRIIADPIANQPLNIAKKYTKDTQGVDFGVPNTPSSSLAKQSGIARTFDLAVQGSPEYKSAIFGAYSREMPDLMEQIGAKNYDDLMEKAYRQMAKETDDQFKQLPYNFSYHRAGEGNYNGAKDMASDVHGNRHLYVYQGGDKHDFLHNVDPQTGLNENEKFRAVHDLLGHAIYGNEFGPKGEEMAWAVHQQMYSPLARMAMTAETRGQNSVVNYSPLNAKLKKTIAEYESLSNEARRRGDKALVKEIEELKRQAYSGLEFAPNKAVLLPPEFMNPQFTGGMPLYLKAANRPTKGTETGSVLTHYSNEPNLQLIDPTRYGTGIKGAEAERLMHFPGGVRDRSYFYLGEPGAVAPEAGLGGNRYRGESSSLYDITQDPLDFRLLAREANRTPFTARANAGVTYPLQEANDYERLVKEYGYEGMINPNATKPMGIMFEPTKVEPRMAGGGFLSKLGKAAKAARAAEDLVPAAGRMKFADQPMGGLNIVKETGGNFLTGRVEKDVAPLKRGVVNEEAARRLMGDAFTNERMADPVNNALNKWIDSNLSNYIKKQMGTPDDPVRALAEQGITHKADLLREDQVYADSPIMDQRRAAGFPEEGVAQSPLAKSWEYISDSSIASHRAGDIQGMPEKFTKRDEAERKMIAARDALYNKFVDHLKSTGISEDQANYVARETPFDLKARAVGDQDFLRASIDYQATNDPMMSSYITLGRENPWIAKVAPETQVYSPYTGDLGFDHIVDVLKQDVAEGRIRPEQLNKVSMEQAVRRTYEYDQEMAKKMAETQAKVTEGMPVYKEYPEGYKWIELSKPEDPTELPPTHQIEPYESKVHGGTGYRVVNTKTGMKGEGFQTPERATKEFLKSNSEERLADALKYEGDTMGHCVGGYCPDVIEGRSRIYSLRDAKGEPHVTVEVAPNSKPYPVSGEAFAMLPSKTKAEYGQYVREWRQRNPDIEELTDEHTTQALKEAGVPPQPDRIVQIKGKGNRAPKEDYLPFVQDFVRGGNWSDVGDLRNTGLRATSDAFNETEQAFLKSKGVELKPYIDPEETARYQDLFKQTPPAEGMAGGGSVGLKNALNNLLRTDKPEVHMGLGGAAAKVAAKAAKAPAVIPNLLRRSTASEIGREERALRQAAAQAEVARAAAASQTPMPIGYVKHTNLSPNPHVGYRYEAKQLPGIAKPTPIDIGRLEREKKGASLGVMPWDSQSRNVEVSSISGEPLTINLNTHGGQPYALDEKHLEELIGGSSSKEVAEAIQERDRYAMKENREKGGTGEVIHAVTTMGKFGENYANPPSEFAFELINRRLQEGRLTQKDLDYLNNLVKTHQDKTSQRKKGIFPYANFAGFETPEGMEQIYTGGYGLKTSPGNLRKAIAANLHKVEQQKLLGFNSEDLINATTEPSLRGVDKGYIGGTLLSNDIGSAGLYGPRQNQFGMELAPASGFPYESPYSTNFSAQYYGQLPDMIPLDVLMHRQLAPIEQGLLARKNKKPYTEKSLRNAAIGSLEKSNEGVSQVMDSRFFQDLSDYMEALNKPLEKKKGGLAQTKKVKRHGNTVPH